MKKSILIMISLLAAASMLSGCGKTATGSGDTASLADVSEAVSQAAELDNSAPDAAEPEENSEPAEDDESAVHVENEAEEDPTIASLKTIGDVIALEGAENWGKGSVSEKYIYVFSLNGTYYRAIAAMPEDVSQAMWDIDIMDEQRDEKQNALVSPLELESVDNLSQSLLSQDELDKLVGKTGQELLDSGWLFGGCDNASKKFFLYYKYFSYSVEVNEDFELPESFADESLIKPLTVKSITLIGATNAMSLD